MQQKIRIGILVNTIDQLQRWQISCVELLQNHSSVEIVFAAAPYSDENISSHSPLWKKVLDQNLGWKILWKYAKPFQIQEINFDWSFTKAEAFNVSINRNRFELHAESIEKLKSYKPDLILRLGWGILQGEILDIPQFGVWSFHHNDPHVFRGGPPAFWEIYHQKNIQGAVLQRINHKLDGGQILTESTIRTNQHSFRTSYNEIVKESPLLLQKAIAKTLRDQEAVGPTINRRLGVFKTFPNNGQLISGLCKILHKKLLFQWRKRWSSENWSIVNGNGVLQSIDHAKSKITNTVSCHQCSNYNIFKADPFLLPNNQGILYELFDKKSKKAVIAWADRSGENEKIVLETGKHLSYPFILEFENNTYVIPEQKSEDKLQVYQWNQDLKELTASFSIAISNCIDPTFLFYNNKWWLFCTHPFQSNAHLHIYYSEKLEGPYLPHSQNPVKMDVQSARPAGQFQSFYGKLFRPAQCNDRFYGAGINWMEITSLTPEHFSEKKVEKWSPEDFGVLGIHHISSNKQGVVIDVKTKNAAF